MALYSTDTSCWKRFTLRFIIHTDKASHLRQFCAAWNSELATRAVYIMKKHQTTSPDAANLHRHAKQRMAESEHQINSSLSRENTQKLLHELQALQTKLEMHNKELRQSREEAEKASRAAGEFLADMSHEIRTPMNSILGMTQLALDNTINPKARSYLEKVLLSSEHLRGIIDDILDYSQIQAGKLSMVKVDFCLDEIKGKLDDMLAAKAVKRDLNLVFDFDPAIPHFLCGDPLRLSQILINYVSNAIKFTKHGEITIRTRKIKEGKTFLLLRFEVQDTGAGISAEDISKLFRPFQQADSSTTRKYGGSGLGLAISKRLAELMGGGVGVESVVGKGSTFWFTARLGKGKRKLSEITSATDVTATLKGANILLVEDDKFNQEVATEFMRHAGVNVFIAQNGEEALNLLRHEHFDCVLMDIQMPVMGGLETIQHIRSDPMLAKLRVIAMTANASDRERERFLSAGMDDFISKPFKSSVLYATLAKWLSARPPQASFTFLPATPDTETIPSDSADIIDLAEVADFSGNTPEKIREFVFKFIESAREDVANIKAALEREDIAGTRTIAHRLLTPALMVGAKEVADLCRVLEQQGNDGEGMQQVRKIAGQLQPLLERIERHVKERMGSG